MQDRERNITFDWDKALSFEGNSGPYIQYAAVRARKIADSHHPKLVKDSGSQENGFFVPQNDEGDCLI
jgi:arginyl-tRNA synthetase